MAKQKIQVELGFMANTDQAKKALNALSAQLSQITSGQTLNLDKGLTEEIQAGIDAAQRLNAVLKSAMNVNTGKLDLGKFQQSLKESGMTIQSLRKQLEGIGPSGQQAFLDLAKAVNFAEVPVLRINKTIQKMGQTLTNTMRWQISSSVLQGISGAFQSALGYAEDLNESLNNIRIVTGYSADEMDKFAIKANKAAKALSATTTEYTNASLIYFQQGLNDAEVEKRTQTTIKLANVTGESAETVSEWMTAVWNNFDDGSKSLEHYADVMTALGAATASSSDEIAQGLEKFAAIANTIGLSYEYAASALATVTAQTRQSADIVGTAFKTIFGRMEGLTLGEELDDGTNLNKYSQSLKTVGVDIMNTSGELKSMDTILNELGARWDSLTQAQKVALAQTVGGMRQYNQLIALMDNWDYFQQNLQTSLGSTGALDEQAEIYAESWEAARDRVTAAAETIYQELLNDDAFIGILDFFADFLGFIDKTIDSIGGLRGVILLLGTVVTNVFSKQLASGLNNVGLFFNSLIPASRKKIEDQKAEIWKEANKMSIVSGGTGPVSEAQSTAFERELQNEYKYQEMMQGRSQLEKDIYRQNVDFVNLKQKESVEAAKALETAEEKLKIEKDLVNTTSKAKDSAELEVANYSKLKEYAEQQAKNAKNDQEAAIWKEHVDNANQNLIISQKELAKATKAVDDAVEGEKQAVEQVARASDKYDQAASEAEQANKKLQQSYTQLTPVTYSYSEVIIGIANAITQVSFAINSLSSIGDIIKDDDLSGWEKFTSVLTSLSTLIPLVVNGFKLFSNETLKNTIIKIANALATAEQTRQLKKQKTATDEATASIKKNTAAETADTVQDVVKDGITYRKRVTNGKVSYRQLGKGGKTLSKEAGEAIFGSGITKIAPALGKILAIIGPIVIAVAAIGVTVTLITKHLNKHNEAAKKARNTAKDLKKAYEETKSAYDNLTSTMASYEDAAKGLEELTRGTLEFKEALVKTNDQAVALINQYDSLQDKWHTNEDGLIVFDEGALEDLQAQQLSKTLAAQNAALRADYEADVAELEAERIEALRDINVKDGKINTDEGVTIGGAALGGAAAGAAIGSIFTPAGTAIGAGIGLAVGAIGGAIANAIVGDVENIEKQALQDLQERYAELEATGNQNILNTERGIRDFLEEQSYYSDELADAFVENRKSIYDLIASNHALEESNYAIQLQEAKNANTGNRLYDESNYQNVLDTIAVNKSNAAADTMIDPDNYIRTTGYNYAPNAKEYIGSVYGDWIEGAGQEIKTYKIHEDYLRAVQAGLATLSEDSYTDSFANNEYNHEYYYEITKELESKIQDAYITKYLDGVVGQDYEFDKKGRLVTISKDENGIETRTTGSKISVSDMLTKIIQQQGYELSSEDIEQFNKNLAEVWTPAGITDPEILEQVYKKGGKITDLSNFDIAQIDALKEAAKELGFEIDTSIGESNRKTAFNNIAQDLKDRGLNSVVKFFEGVTDQYSEDQAKAISQNIAESAISGTMGRFINVITAVDSKKLEADISKLATDFDFTSPFALEQFIAQLEDMGYTIEGSVKTAITAYVNAMQNAASATATSSSSIEKLTSNLTIAKKALEDAEIGKLFDEDTYENLKKINPAVEEFFVKTADGYLLLAEGQELYQNQFSQSALEALKQRAKEAIEINKSVDNYLNQDGNLWNKETNKLNNESLLGDASAIKTFMRGLDPNILAAAGIQNVDALGTDLDVLYDYLNAIETVIADSVTGNRDPEQELANLIYFDESINTLEELRALIIEVYGSESELIDDLEDKYDDLIKSREESIKELKDEYGEVYKLNRAIQNQNKALDEVSAAADRAWGANKTALLNKQSKLYDDLADKNKALTAELERQLQLMQQQEVAELGLSKNISFDGLEISSWNYDGLDTEADIKKLTDFIDKYNSKLDEMYAAAEAAAQAVRDAFDTKLEGLQYAIEVNVEIYDYQLDELERQLEKLEDKSFSTAKAIANITQQAGLLNDKMKEYATIQEDLFNTFGVHSWTELMSMEGADQAAIMEMLGTSLEELKEIRDTLYDLDKQVADKMVEAFQEWGEEFDKINAKAQRFNSIVNSYKNIVDLTRQFTDIDSEVVKQMTNASVEIAKTQMEVSREKWKTLQDEYNKIKIELEKTDKELATQYGEDPMGTRDYWQSKLDEIKEQVEQAQVDYLGSWEEALQTAADAYSTIMSEIFRDFEKQMTGSFGSFDAMLEYYDQQSKLSELWLNDYEKIYELTKLNRKLNQDIDETDNIKAKKELRELQEEINLLQESDTKLSKYDLEYLQKKYDLRLAEIALEEAQKAKGSVQLTRNASGGWGYVYTADADKVADAEQKLEDAIFDLQEFGNETLLQLGQQITQLKSDWVDALEEIYSSGLSEEELQKALNTTNEYYKTTIEDLSKQFDKTLKNNSSLFDETFRTDTANLLRQGEGFVTAWEHTIIAKLGDGTSSGLYKTMADNTSKFINEVMGTAAEGGGNGLLGQLQQNYQNYRDVCDGILDIAGTDFEELGAKISEEIGTASGENGENASGILGDLEKLKTEYQKLKEKIEKENGAMIGNISAWKEAVVPLYSEVVSAIAAVESAAKLAKQAIDDLAAAQAEADLGGGGFVTIPGGEKYEGEGKFTQAAIMAMANSGARDFADADDVANYIVDMALNHFDPTGDATFTAEEIETVVRNIAANKGLGLYEDSLADILDNYNSILEDRAKPEDPPEDPPNESFIVDISDSAITSNSSVGQSSAALGFKEDRLDGDNTGKYSIGDQVKITSNNGYGIAVPVYDEKQDKFTYNSTQGKIIKPGPIEDIEWDQQRGKWFYKVNGYWVDDSDIIGSMDTGGYTGAWGPEGRLAILHEKEIVLNKHDTENFLSALGILDSIVRMIDLEAAARQADTSFMQTNRFLAGAQSLEQQVTIHAEFPNATDHNEIEEAFNNLINKASQYANRKI